MEVYQAYYEDTQGHDKALPPPYADRVAGGGDCPSADRLWFRRQSGDRSTHSNTPAYLHEGSKHTYSDFVPYPSAIPHAHSFAQSLADPDCESAFQSIDW